MLFPADKRTYLDWASAAPVSKSARKEFLDALEIYGNPSSPHAEGDAAKRLLEDARKRIATLAGTKPDAVIFTSGATEANNLTIQGYVSALLQEGTEPEHVHLLYLPTAHASVIQTMEALAANGIDIEPIALKDGRVDLAGLASQIRTTTVLVSMDLICGETGTRFATRDVRRVLDVAAKDFGSDRIALHVDASQAPFVESYEHTHLGADFITLDAQKVGAVRGIGVLICPRPRMRPAPIMYGGGQEQGIRPGTESPAIAQSLAVALEEAEEGRDDFVARSKEMRTNLMQTIEREFPDVLFTEGAAFAPHILNMSFLSRDTDYLVMLLSEKGFAVSTKSACETDSTGSRTVLALTADPERSLSTLRVSWGPTTSSRELESFAQELMRAVRFIDSHTLTAA